MFTPTDRDYSGLVSLEREIRANPDKTAKIECFNREEADWIRGRLRARGLAGRFFMSWLTFRRDERKP